MHPAACLRDHQIWLDKIQATIEAHDAASAVEQHVRASYPSRDACMVEQNYAQMVITTLTNIGPIRPG